MSATLFSAQLCPARALGFLVLGASLHDILTRLKAEPHRFPKLDLTYSQTDPVREPVTLGLPANGIRLRFDGPDQRLRLIEVLDFAKNHIFFKEQNNERDLVRPTPAAQLPNSEQQSPPAGPTFRHIYQRFLGPTYDGEFIPGGTGGDSEGMGTYVLSYPGVAFTFPMIKSAYSPDKDVVSLLPSSSCATSMAVFVGDSWTQARQGLWAEVLPSIRLISPLPKGKDISPDEVSLVQIHGGGKLRLFRGWTSSSMWVMLGETTPQELVAELGPPDAIYRKNDQRMYIHKIRTASSSRTRPINGGGIPGSYKRQDDLTDTDQSSAATASDESNDEAVEDEFSGNVSSECFYNYFYLGFDVLVSTPTAPSQGPPSQDGNSVGPPDRPVRDESPDQLVVTKFVLHANVPGSYPFNRHRRCRWEIPYLEDATLGAAATVNSETLFSDIEDRLRAEWRPVYPTEAEARQRQRGMVLNRGWGDSPGSSCELLGGWEESAADTVPGIGPKKFDGSEDSTTTLYGFPGLVFEVLKNGFVSAVTVF